MCQYVQFPVDGLQHADDQNISEFISAKQAFSTLMTANKLFYRFAPDTIITMTFIIECCKGCWIS